MIDVGYMFHYEKIPISKTACAGMHYFRKGSDFVKYAEIMIKNNQRFNNEFYVTPVYNELAKSGKKIITFPILKKWALGSKDEINQFLSYSLFYQSQHRKVTQQYHIYLFPFVDIDEHFLLHQYTN